MDDVAQEYQVGSEIRSRADNAVRIWDLPVRLFHWALVACVCIAAISGWFLPVNWLTLHLVAGAAIGALLIFRLIWGFTGSAYSRFASFVFSPGVTMDHVRALLNGRAPREIGHNPLGALMVFAFAAVLVALVVTGTIVLGGAFKQGPLKAMFSFTAGWLTRDMHQVLAFILLALIAGHLSGVIFESLRTRENLAGSMITGRKRSGFDHRIDRRAPQAVRAILASALAGAICLGVISLVTRLHPYGVPQFSANATWKKECSACHMAFHPSLLPAASWGAIMDGLPEHFGEDASLGGQTVSEIKAFLMANAAERWDTLAANRLSKLDSARPLEITATPYWMRMHRAIAADVFASKAVAAKQNCAACHGDAATGLFAPQSIAIPKEPKG